MLHSFVRRESLQTPAFLSCLMIFLCSGMPQAQGQADPLPAHGTIMETKSYALRHSPQEPGAGVMVLQSLAGLGLGLGGGFLGLAIGAGMASCGGDDFLCGITEALIGAAIGYPLGTALGIWSVGKAKGGLGSFWGTYLGTGLGTLVGVVAGIAVANLDMGMAPVLFLGISNLGGMAAYHATDGIVRTRVSLEKCREPGSGGPGWNAGVDVVLARW